MKHRRSNVLLTQRAGARPHPVPCGLFGSQKIRHARMPYSVGETEPRMNPWRTSVPLVPQNGQARPRNRSRNRSIAPLLLKNRCIRGRIPSSGPEPSLNPHGAHLIRPMTPSINGGTTALQGSATFPKSDRAPHHINPAPKEAALRGNRGN